MSRVLSHSVLACLSIVLMAETVNADLVLDLRYTDLTTSKTVNSGDHVFVDLLITDTDASTSLVASGLQTGGGRLVRTAGTITLTPGAITGNMDWDPGSINTNPGCLGAGLEIAKFLAAVDFLLREVWARV